MITQSYDLDAGALYIELADHQVARTAQVDTGTLVDLDAAGNVVGIEVIRPDRSWPLETILEEFAVARQDALELRAYFPHFVGIVPPAHPAARVPVAVGLSNRRALECSAQVHPHGSGHVRHEFFSFR